NHAPLPAANSVPYAARIELLPIKARITRPHGRVELVPVIGCTVRPNMLHLAGRILLDLDEGDCRRAIAGMPGMEEPGERLKLRIARGLNFFAALTGIRLACPHNRT